MPFFPQTSSAHLWNEVQAHGLQGGERRQGRHQVWGAQAAAV